MKDSFPVSRGVRRLREGLAALLAVAVSALPAGPRLEADALLLVDGSAVEGEIKESATEFEVVTDHGSLWVDKVKVKKRFPSVDQILAGVQETQRKARALFEQAKQIDEKEAHNARLREAVKTLEGGRDVLVEAQEVYASMLHYLRLSQQFKQIIQELRIYRDQFQVGGTAGPKTAAAAVAGRPSTSTDGAAAGAAGIVPAAPPASAGTAPSGGSGTSSGGASATAVAPIPASPEPESAALIKDAKALLAAGSVDEAFAKFQQLIREGGDVSSLRPEMARAFYERGMKQSPPALTDLRRAFDLDPSSLAYYESFLQASYERGLDSARNKRWNDATKEFTQAIRAASELLAKSDKAMYHNRRGTAYHWRGIAEVQKFKGKSGHLQIRSDYRQAKADYEAVLRLEPEGPFAREARDNLENVNNTLRQLH